MPNPDGPAAVDERILYEVDCPKVTFADEPNSTVFAEELARPRRHACST
jgi:hypothetical protein